MKADQLMNFADQVPKVINPRAHAVIDYMTAGTFFAMGFAMRGRHAQASTLAFANGAAVLALSAMTDYPGGLFRAVSFKMHGVADLVLAAMCGAGPAMMGFAGQPEAQAFHAQAALELGVIAATDFEAA